MSFFMTLIGAWIGEGAIHFAPVSEFFGKWPRNFSIAFLVEALIAQPIARQVLYHYHLKKATFEWSKNLGSKGFSIRSEPIKLDTLFRLYFLRQDVGILPVSCLLVWPLSVRYCNSWSSWSLLWPTLLVLYILYCDIALLSLCGKNFPWVHYLSTLPYETCFERSYFLLASFAIGHLDRYGESYDSLI